MKIRTRLFLFFLPPLILTNILLGTLLTYWSYQDALQSHTQRLKSSMFSRRGEQDYFTTLEKNKEIEKITITKDPFSSFPSLQQKDDDFYLSSSYLQNNKKMIAASAPYQDGYILIESSLESAVHSLQKHIIVAFLCIILLILIACLCLFALAKKIADPVQKLNNSALAIAAGCYENKVEVKGPKEIVDLSNTLNTMGECLQENINHLKENAILREKMYGEYESSLHFQHTMLNKAIENCSSDMVSIQSISFFSNNPKGVLLDFPTLSQEELSIQLTEAKEKGFEGMYELLTHYKLAKSKKPKYPSLQLQLAPEKKLLLYQSYRTSRPILWSSKKKQILPIQKENRITAGDFFFIYNEGLRNFYPNLEGLIKKVMDIFSEEGIGTIKATLQKELAFLTKKKDLEEDIHLICFQLLW